MAVLYIPYTWGQSGLIRINVTSQAVGSTAFWKHLLFLFCHCCIPSIPPPPPHTPQLLYKKMFLFTYCKFVRPGNKIVLSIVCITQPILAVHQKGQLNLWVHLETCSIGILAVPTVMYCCFYWQMYLLSVALEKKCLLNAPNVKCEWVQSCWF